MDNKPKLPNQLPMKEIIRFASSPAGQQLIALMQKQGGKDFQTAMERAASGDYSQAKQALESVMENPEARRLLKEFGR